MRSLQGQCSTDSAAPGDRVSTCAILFGCNSVQMYQAELPTTEHVVTTITLRLCQDAQTLSCSESSQVTKGQSTTTARDASYL